MCLFEPNVLKVLIRGFKVPRGSETCAIVLIVELVCLTVPKCVKTCPNVLN